MSNIHLGECRLPTRVTLRGGQRGWLETTLTAEHISVYTYLGVYPTEFGNNIPVLWDRYGKNRESNFIDIVKIGWNPDFNWDKVPEYVRWITKSRGSKFVAGRNTKPTYDEDDNGWKSDTDYYLLMPAGWVGLEAWEGGPDAILERA